MFGWLRNRVRDSILAGVNDAAEVLARDADSPTSPPLALRLTLERLEAPPAIEDARPAKKKQPA